MNKSKSIQLITGTTTTDKYIIIQLEQNIDTLEFMSLNIDSNDIYQNFNADYGVLIGRVNANDGVGIPNAKISIFIPLTSDDAVDEDIFSIYPYVSPTDKNLDGKRYNLLPRVSQFDSNGIASPKQPFGSFPIKPEIVTNPNFLNVYQKYYKYTTVTNNSGDYMLFGVPIGTQTVHMSVDITDIGKYSMKPASMVTDLGYSPNLFTDNNTKIKPKNDLGDLINIETQEISVDIIPFWGDTVNFQIGITRQDFRIRAELVSTFIIFGSAFTDGVNSTWGSLDNSLGSDFQRAQVEELHLISGGDQTNVDINIGINSKRIGSISETIYYYPNNISDSDIDSQINNDNIDFTSQMHVLKPSEYSSYKRNGDFVFIIKCNRHKVITDDSGNEIQVPDNSTNGIFNQFRGFITFEISNDNIPLNLSTDIGHGQSQHQFNTLITSNRYKFKIPQYSDIGKSFVATGGTNTNNWRKQNKLFSGGTIYSVAKFNGLIWNNQTDGGAYKYDIKTNTNGGYLATDQINTAYLGSQFLNKHYNVGLIQTDGIDVTGNTRQQMVSNIIDTTNRQYFGGNWLNLTLYFPQVSIFNSETPVSWFQTTTYPRGILSTSHYTQDFYLLQDNNKTGTYDKNQLVLNNKAFDYYFPNKNTNNQLIGDTQFNTFGFARSDLHPTDFIIVPKKILLP